MTLPKPKPPRDLVKTPLVLIPQHFGSLVFERATSRYLPFDHETTDLLRQLQVDRPSVVASKASDPEAFLALWSSLATRGFTTPDGRFAGAELALEPSMASEINKSRQTHRKGQSTQGRLTSSINNTTLTHPTRQIALTGPLAVHLEIIGACNLACKHCFAGPLPRNTGPLQLGEIVQLFDELAAIGSYRLGLTGGEPLLRKDLFDMLDEAAERGLHPCLTTNGLLIDEDIAKKLGARDFAWLNVSLDGASAATNDAVRGDGVFDAVRDRLRILAKHARFTLAFTITSANASEVEECVQLAHEVGAHTAVFRPLYPTGTALSHPELMPSYDQYADALERLEAYANVGLDTAHEVCGIDPFSPQIRADSQARTSTHHGCGAGTTVCSVSVQGQVNPCSFLGPTHDAGNIRERSFRSIWNDSAGFTAMRKPELDSCGACGGFQGGCRARALAASGSAHDADPWMAAFRRRRRAHHPKANIELQSARTRTLTNTSEAQAP